MTIKIENDGYVNCKSNFYSAQDIISSDTVYLFDTGINKLIGEIDSGIWAISYLLSMYDFIPQNFVLFKDAVLTVNNERISLNEFCKYSCYLDESYPLFNTKKSVKRLIEEGLKKSKLTYSVQQIKDIFLLDEELFERPAHQVGNERFRAMSAIAFAHGKKVFCFPWLSQKRYNYYNNNILKLLEILNQLEMIVILPIGYSGQD
ncbi:MAG: hypothetical protein J6B80_02135 [Clostridia bacterium]|nr:hypothetical protein [Clostridia bacterium]